MTDRSAENGLPRKYRCCACCEGIAKDDHIGHGGTVEKDGHDAACGTCEFEERIRPRLAQAWDEGKHSEHTPACRFGDGDCICPNPYRPIPPDKNDAI